MLKIAGKCIVINPASEQERQMVEAGIVPMVQAGYVVEMRKWGAYVVHDPAIKFKWEMEDALVDIKRLLGITS